jgi:hypothetical protein
MTDAQWIELWLCLIAFGVWRIVFKIPNKEK